MSLYSWCVVLKDCIPAVFLCLVLVIHMHSQCVLVPFAHPVSDRSFLFTGCPCSVRMSSFWSFIPVHMMFLLCSSVLFIVAHIHSKRNFSCSPCVSWSRAFSMCLQGHSSMRSSVQILERHSDVDREVARVCGNLGICHAALGNYGESVDCFQKVIICAFSCCLSHSEERQSSHSEERQSWSLESIFAG